MAHGDGGGQGGLTYAAGAVAGAANVASGCGAARELKLCAHQLRRPLLPHMRSMRLRLWLAAAKSLTIRPDPPRRRRPQLRL